MTPTNLTPRALAPLRPSTEHHVATERAFRTARTVFAVLVMGLLAGGCQLLDAAANNSSCVEHGNDYATALAAEGQLNPEVPTPEPYPMAIVVSQTAVNELFAAVANADVPPIALSGEPLPGLPVTVTIDPQLPLLQVGGENGCSSCLLTEVGFGLTVDVAGSAVGGLGAARYQFPLFMQPNGLESTGVVAQLGQSSFLSIDLQISGVDNTIMNFFEPLITDALTYLVTNEYGDTNLFNLKAWEIGNGDVRLLGRGPHVDPEAKTIVIGMHTNLMQPTSSSIAWNPALPEGADIGLQLHPELVQAMIGRMMNEGHVPRAYDTNGKANPAGNQQVTLNTMRADDNGLLATNFRLWRTAGGFCGFADMQASLGLSISDKALKLAVQDVFVTDSSGAGDLLQFANDWIGSEFLNDVVSISELTINYNELEIPGGKRADMSAESFRLQLGGDGLSLFLNIDAIVDAVTE